MSREGNDRDGQKEKTRPGDAGRSTVISIITDIGLAHIMSGFAYVLHSDGLMLGILFLFLFILLICFYTNSFSALKQFQTGRKFAHIIVRTFFLAPLESKLLT